MKGLRVKARRSRLRIKNILFLLSTIYCLLSTAIMADASYRIYLKNGSVIKGVSHYEKLEGEIRFSFGGGTVGIPETAILKIEITREPPDEKKGLPSSKEKIMPAEPERRVESPIWNREKDSPVTKPHPAEIGKKSAEIKQKETALRKIEEDLNKTMIRIQSLYSKIGKGTITADERSMLQQNMVKKRRLEDDKEKLKEELKTLLEEKERLIKGQ